MRKKKKIDNRNVNTLNLFKNNEGKGEIMKAKGEINFKKWKCTKKKKN